MKRPTKHLPKSTKPIPLCYRCESRAAARETGSGPRYECGQTGAVAGCYMYRPVVPLVIARNPGDARELVAPWFIAARSHAIAHAKTILRVHKVRGGVVIWHDPSSKRHTTEDRQIEPDF